MYSEKPSVLYFNGPAKIAKTLSRYNSLRCSASYRWSSGILHSTMNS